MEERPRPDGRPSARRTARDPSDVAHPDAAAVEFVLGRPETWALEQVRRRGATGFIAMMTAFSVVVSVVFVSAAMVTAFGADPDYLVPGVVMGAATPALVAPLALSFTVRLAERLDTAGLLLRRAALTDPLTGVLNRRGFFDALDELRGSGRVAEIAMVDVDDFKRLNDRHGHAAGDRVLCDVANWLVELLGDAGTVARIGGDEFAYLAEPDAERNLPARRSLTIGATACTITIGRSICAAGEDPETALVRADADLYRRKSDQGGTDPVPDERA